MYVTISWVKKQKSPLTFPSHQCSLWPTFFIGYRNTSILYRLISGKEARHSIIIMRVIMWLSVVASHSCCSIKLHHMDVPQDLHFSETAASAL